jgi:hypothetical protein
MRQYGLSKCALVLPAGPVQPHRWRSNGFTQARRTPPSAGRVRVYACQNLCCASTPEQPQPQVAADPGETDVGYPIDATAGPEVTASSRKL